MTFQTQPPGNFQYINHSNKDAQKIEELIEHNKFGERFCILVDQNFKRVENVTQMDIIENESPVDHPIMVLAEKFGKILVNSKNENIQLHGKR